MKNYANFIGIDISKLKIDVAVFEVEKNKDSVKKSYVNFIFDNSPSGFQKMNRELKKIKTLLLTALFVWNILAVIPPLYVFG